MADSQKSGLAERDIEQAIFQRYPRPEKEYQSFSLICNDRSLDLICKDKDEAEVWFVGLKALVNRSNNHCKWRIDTRSDSTSSDSPHSRTRKKSPSITPFDPGDGHISFEDISHNRLGKAFSDILSQTAAANSCNQEESAADSLISLSTASLDNINGRNSTTEAVRVSYSSAISSSSHGSSPEDFDALGDVFIWGDSIGDGLLGGGVHRVGPRHPSKMDAFLPKALESIVVLDVHNIACGARHAVLVTRQGEIFSWGEESGGRLGHGMEADVSHPKLIDSLSGMNIESIACGEYHTCAVTVSGDLYTWGDGTHNAGILGHGSEVSHWIPKRVTGQMEGMHVSYVSCGPWHTAAVTSAGQLFTFGEGSFGALGHGDHISTTIPREVETLRGLRTTMVACGAWHTAAVVEVMTDSSSPEPSGSSSSGKLFSWGAGDKGQLGHGDKETRLVPMSVAELVDEHISQVACGDTLTIALTASGQVYTMGSAAHGQLGNPTADGMVPTHVKGKMAECCVEIIACGSHHVAVLTSKSEVYTWGKGANGQLGHGDNGDRNIPTLVGTLKDKQVKSIACGSNFTAIICIHKWVSHADNSLCSSCHNPFGFRRKRHNCYNCGLVFCKACSSRKSLKASLAPNMSKPYRVCDDCFMKLKRALESGSSLRISKMRGGNVSHKSNDLGDRDLLGPKLQTQLSRLSSSDSVNQANSRHSWQGKRLEYRDNRIFASPNENFKLRPFNSFKASNTTRVSVPGSRGASRTTSPLSLRSSPPRSSNATLDGSKHYNDILSQEITSLRAQVEDLTNKSYHLETELERTSKQLKVVSAIATDEAEKCKSAKEVIKSLTAQLKEMAERMPEGQISDGLDSDTKHTSNVQKLSWSHSTSVITPERESNSISTNRMISYVNKPQTGRAEWVLQDEPGVYITLSSLPGGGNELKRVRFSRKHFTEQQAEKWWADNGAKVCERHDIRSNE
ncbi:hypothetical protein HS088_TW12G00453 [Tripterygium wilfordii]|uniref:Ran GTPase binding protein n=1 Tax=Tripterygium wilfordii TaxID=458696 RepID=A0A7J7CYS5_TRIWF|nr:hypothetical protein HS088_TW12G00453 [Tripterygium wilfordii]